MLSTRRIIARSTVSWSGVALLIIGVPLLATVFSFKLGTALMTAAETKIQTEAATNMTLPTTPGQPRWLSIQGDAYPEAEGHWRTVRFVEPQDLWDDPDLLEVPAKTEDESRSLVIGGIHDKHGSAIVTYRRGKTRIISVRRAREEERALYES